MNAITDGIDIVFHNKCNVADDHNNNHLDMCNVTILSYIFNRIQYRKETAVDDIIRAGYVNGLITLPLTYNKD